MKLENIKGHFNTINSHKCIVMKECFRVGLFYQGLMHDMSKYSPTEFLIGVQYYQGTRSPNAAERDEKGFSTAWFHHKGRNRHHYEYWIDFASKPDRTIEGHPMPVKYVVEMFMDRVAASKVYKKDEYNEGIPYEYFIRSKDYCVMNPKTAKQLGKLLMMLRDQGEEKTFNYIRALLYRERIKSARRFGRNVCKAVSELKKSSSQE